MIFEPEKENVFCGAKPMDYPRLLAPEEVRGKFMDLLGSFDPPSTPLNIRVTDEKTLDGDVVRQRVEYDVAPGETVPAYHMFKRGIPGDAKGVLSIHAHDGDQGFINGKDFNSRPDPNDPSQYSYRAALNGFRVLAPDALCFGERKLPWGYSEMFYSEVIMHAELCAKGSSLAWKSVWDNSRALEVLEQFGASSIGCIGHSGGSIQSYILAAVNERVKAAACFNSFTTLRHQFYKYRLAHCLYLYIPGMVTAGIDWDQVVALTAPRPVFFGWGKKDEGTPEAMYRAFVDAIKKRCGENGWPVSVTAHEEDTEHDVTEGMLSEAMKFLKTHL